MKAALDPLRNGVAPALPGGHQFTLTGYNWAGMPTREEFAQIRAYAETIDRANEWSLADVIVMEVRLGQAENKKRPVKDIIAAFALARGESVQVWERRYNVGSFYPYVARVKELFWTHHRDVWAWGPGSLGEAKRWLARAVAGQWDVAELRRQLLASRRVQVQATPELPIIFPRELEEACGWASARLDEVEALEPEQAAERLAGLDPLLQYAERLRTRAAALVGPSQEPQRR